MQTGEAYETAETLVCPECGGETRIDVNHLKTIHERQLKLLRQTRERLRTMGI
jgi:hypothetical protein